MAVTLPSKVAERGIKAEHARAINQLIDVVRKIQLVAGPDQAIEQTPNGTTLKIKQTGKTVTMTTSEESWFY
jgi:hypothetical protein|tara:strand:+ start:322 stop:537 length:216 start_codon:yes stop_codon:yes gene_type:complete